MNKSELVAKVASTAGITKNQASSAVTAVLNTIAQAVAKGDTVRLPGFGTFERRERKKRKAVNPRTRKPMQIPARKVPAFKAGSIFKEVVANPGKASKLLAVKSAAKPAGKAATTRKAASKAKAAPKKPAARKAARPAAKPAAKRATARKAAPRRARK